MIKLEFVQGRSSLPDRSFFSVRVRLSNSNHDEQCRTAMHSFTLILVTLHYTNLTNITITNITNITNDHYQTFTGATAQGRLEHTTTRSTPTKRQTLT